MSVVGFFFFLEKNCELLGLPPYFSIGRYTGCLVFVFFFLIRPGQKVGLNRMHASE